MFLEERDLYFKKQYGNTFKEITVEVIPDRLEPVVTVDTEEVSAR